VSSSQTLTRSRSDPPRRVCVLPRQSPSRRVRVRAQAAWL